MPHAPAIPAPHRPQSTLVPRLPRRRLLLASLGLTLLGPAACAIRPGPVVDRPFRLAISDGLAAPRYLPLDPRTLADRPDQPVLPPSATGVWASSADGSTLLELLQLDPQPIVAVRDGRTLAERRRFTLPAPIVGVTVRLSADGRRLVVQRNPGMSPEPDTWDVVDTASGQLLTTVRSSTRGNTWQWWIDAAARRLCTPELTTGVDNPAPRPLRLAAFDLQTGAALETLALPDVLAGSWADGRVVDGDPVVRQRYPALAQTPDAQRLAIFTAEPASLTLVDMPRLRVARRFTVAAPPSLPSVFTALLPFWPQAAEAKALEGAALNGVVGPGGRGLYVWGSVSTMDADGQTSARPFGLQRLDLAAGRVTATALTGVELYAVEPGLDGRSLYVYGRDAGSPLTGPDWTGVLRRLDAATLAVIAERPFTGYRSLLLLPS